LTVVSGQLEGVNLAAGESKDYDLAYTYDPRAGKEYFLNIYADLKSDEGLVSAATVLAREQFVLPKKPLRAEPAEKFPALSLQKGKESLTISGESFEIGIDKTSGVITRYMFEGKDLIQRGPVPNFWRAPIDNDFGNGNHQRAKIWRKAGERMVVKKIKVKKDKSGPVIVEVNGFLTGFDGEAIADQSIHYTIRGNGEVRISNSFEISGDKLPEIPRFGMNLVMPREFEFMTWFGRGPHESYWDRKTSAFVDLYSGTVAEQYWPYLRPQENGNKEEVRWAVFTNKQGMGLRFEGQPLLSVSAHHNMMEDFESPERTDGRHIKGVKPVNRHTTDVIPRELTSIHVDYRQMGVGGDNSWGARTHEEYRLTGKSYSYSFTMKPVKNYKIPTGK
jgi:beta-galactosidase